MKKIFVAVMAAICSLAVSATAATVAFEELPGSVLALEIDNSADPNNVFNVKVTEPVGTELEFASSNRPFREIPFGLPDFNLGAPAGGKAEWLVRVFAALSGDPLPIEDWAFLTFDSVHSTGLSAALSAQQPPVVPLPAGMLLMGTALGGLGLVRRRRKRAA